MALFTNRAKDSFEDLAYWTSALLNQQFYKGDLLKQQLFSCVTLWTLICPQLMQQL